MKWLNHIFLASLLSMNALPLLADVVVKDAWVRLLPPMVKTTAAYMTILSDTADQLLSISSPLAERIEMHQSSMEEGMMSMLHVESIQLPKGESVTLSPHSYHLMVIGLNAVLKAGDQYPFTFNFKHAGPLEVLIPVVSP